MKRLSLVIAVAAVVAVWPASSGAATLRGVVVAKQHGALLVASPSGSVSLAWGRASIGARVAVSGGRATVVGRARSARIRGIVVRRVGSTLFLSSNRHLVAVRTGRVLASASDTTPAPPAGSTTPPPTAPTTPTTPAPGTIVSSQVTIQSGGELDEESSQSLGQTNASALQVSAVVSAVGTGTVTLTVGTQTLTVPLPAGLTLPASMVGQTVTLSVDLNGQSSQGDESGGDDNGGSSGGSDTSGAGASGSGGDTSGAGGSGGGDD